MAKDATRKMVAPALGPHDTCTERQHVRREGSGSAYHAEPKYAPPPRLTANAGVRNRAVCATHSEMGGNQLTYSPAQSCERIVVISDGACAIECLDAALAPRILRLTAVG